LINAASATQFWIDLGELTGTIIAADGHPVRPVRGTRFPPRHGPAARRAD